MNNAADLHAALQSSVSAEERTMGFLNNRPKMSLKAFSHLLQENRARYCVRADGLAIPGPVQSCRKIVAPPALVEAQTTIEEREEVKARGNLENREV